MVPSVDERATYIADARPDGRYSLRDRSNRLDKACQIEYWHLRTATPAFAGIQPDLSIHEKGTAMIVHRNGEDMEICMTCGGHDGFHFDTCATAYPEQDSHADDVIDIDDEFSYAKELQRQFSGNGSFRRAF